MLFTSEGRLVVFRTPVWFVFSKLVREEDACCEHVKWSGDEGETYQSTHCGKTDWKVSVQEHLITSMNAPGLKRTCELMARFGELSGGSPASVHTIETLAKAVAAWAQESMLG